MDGGWFERFRRRVVRRSPVGEARRRPSDLVRIVIAVLLLVALAFHAHHPTKTEQNIVDVFHSLPDGATTFFRLLFDLITLWALALLVVTVLFARRWRLARDLLVAGAAAWLLGRVTAFFVQRTDLWHSLQVTFDFGRAPRFPLVRLSMVVAMVIVASPHLTRPARRLGGSLVVVLALAAMYLGRSYPTDLLGAVVLGWGVAAAVHYAFGTPQGRPSVAVVEAALARLRVPATGVRSVPEQPLGRALFLADVDEHPVRIAALGRDEADAQLLSRAWRYLAYRDAPPTLFPTRRQQVEYEAYVALLARDNGVDCPAVVVAGNTGSVAILVEENPAGTALFDLDPGAVNPALLAGIWALVASLQDAGIAHGKLDGRHILVADGSPMVAGFDWAATSARAAQLSADVAQALAATAAVAGPSAAAAAARAGIGDERLAAALPFLQPAALSGWTHDAFGGRGELDNALTALRETAADGVGIEPPELRPLARVNVRRLLMAVGALVAVGTLLSRVGDPGEFWNTVRDASWGWVALAIVLAMLTDATYGITFLGCVPIRLPVWPSIELQGALSFSNLTVPVAADTAVQVRFLQKNGLQLSEAVAAGGVLSTVSEAVVQIGLFFLALWLAPDSIDLGRIDTGEIVVVALVALFVVGVVIAVAFTVSRLRRIVLPPVRRAAITMWRALSSPGRVALLVVGNVAAQCLYAGSLLACLHAFGSSVNFWTLLALNIGISTIASLVPIPGGGTAVTSIGLAGTLTALGVAAPSAAAAVLAHQVAVSYLPAIPGWFAMNDLIRKRLL
jgi:glycosyltransferase 2 family protein